MVRKKKKSAKSGPSSSSARRARDAGGGAGETSSGSSSAGSAMLRNDVRDAVNRRRQRHLDAARSRRRVGGLDQAHAQDGVTRVGADPLAGGDGGAEALED